MADAAGVRAARSDELRELAMVFAQAFGSTATFRWLIEDDAARARLLPAFFEGSLRHVQATPGANLVTDRDRAGADSAPGAALTAGTAPGLVRAADGATLREFGQKGPVLDRALAAAHPAEPHWYLSGLAVAPAAQGGGAGGALVRAGLERSRSQGLPAYLECVHDLIPYYERLGFAVIHEIPLGGGAPEQVGMTAR